MRPLLPSLATAPLRAVIEGELVHLATLTTTTQVRQPGGEYRDETTVFADVPCLLTSPSARDLEIAASRGVAMQFRFLLPLGTAVSVGTTAQVTGADEDGNEWTRAVRLTAVDLPDKLVLACAAVDTELNRGSQTT